MPQRAQVWNSAVRVPNEYLDTCAGSLITTSRAPRGLEVHTPPCLMQNEQLQARAGISAGSGSQVREKEMFPQWHLPWTSITRARAGRRGSPLARDILRAFIAQAAHIDAVQEMLPGTEQDGPDGEMQLVDQAGAQILPDSGYAATEADVAAVRCSARLLQSGVNAFGDKAKLRTSRHPERRPRAMRQHEDRRVIRRLPAPPPPPPLVPAP